MAHRTINARTKRTFFSFIVGMTHMARFMHYSQTASSGGIFLKTQRGAIGTTVWGKRWEQMLTKSDALRVTRGRSYARKGRVLSVRITEQALYAEVQGSSYIPHKVTIEIQSLYSPSQWNAYCNQLSQKSINVASLLEGKMPPHLDDLFKDALIPSSLEAAYTISCTCYDWMPECKHALAVLFIVTEMLDEDPLLLFTLRGKSAKNIIKALKIIRMGSPKQEELALSRFWQEESFQFPTLPKDLSEVNGFTQLKDEFNNKDQNLEKAFSVLYNHIRSHRNKSHIPPGRKKHKA